MLESFFVQVGVIATLISILDALQNVMAYGVEI